MKKLENIQHNKLISSYGGVGSIIETNSNGSLIIQPYDEWGCYQKVKHNSDIINDYRLLQYVKINGYPHVERIIPIPEPELKGKVYSASEYDCKSTVSSKYFPEWYFCPRCRRLKKFEDWKSQWKAEFKLKDDSIFTKNAPACPYCSQQLGKKIEYKRIYLQQIRFVMASLESGKIDDVCFDYLWGNDAVNGIWEAGKGRCKNLYYRTLRDGDGLNSIYIQDGDTKRTIYLSKIDRNYIVKNNRVYKMVVKGSHSLYFPEIVRLLYIPITENKYNVPSDLAGLDLEEFNYLTNDANFVNNRLIKDDLTAIRKEYDEKLHFVSRITSIEKLKETSVLLSYTRMGIPNEQREWYNIKTKRIEPDITPRQMQPFSGSADTITWMPGVEAYGEGILFEINLKELEQNEYETFIHTLCHAVMKEMEFQCGYSLQSLKEKIYCDNENGKGGFLIYTIQGSEGSYGGLVSLTLENKIIKLINRAVERAHYCPNDPICSSETEAHCFACLDIPETSCIKYNKGLDRKLLINKWKC